jgi:hypothetical protein
VKAGPSDTAVFGEIVVIVGARFDVVVGAGFDVGTEPPPHPTMKGTKSRTVIGKIVQSSFLMVPPRESIAAESEACIRSCNIKRSAYFSTTVIVGVVLALLMKTSLFPEMRIAVVPLPKVPVPFGKTEYVRLRLWFCVKPAEFDWSEVPATFPAPSKVATPDSRVTLLAEGFSVPNMYAPESDALLNGPAACDSSTPNSTLASVPTRNPWFGP